jgi:cysteine desulfurase family protein (TIGR01976 family)
MNQIPYAHIPDQAFDPEDARPFFPALQQMIKSSDGSISPPLFLDGPGGTQVPQNVLQAMAGYLGSSNSNLLNSDFFAVRRTHEVVAEARNKAAAFLNAAPENIVFGANMTTLTAHLSRSIAREWQAGDEIILTPLDHFANASFWMQEAQDRGVKVHFIRLNPEDCTLDYAHFESLLSPRTKLVAFTLASNVCGSRVDAARMIKAARHVGAMTFVDAVHAAPHYLPDAGGLGCDFMICSAYKFFGPHYGFLFGKPEHLGRLQPFKVGPAPAAAPDAWETGTKSFEDLAGIAACIEYIASWGAGDNLRARLQASFERVGAYERSWSSHFLKRAAAFRGLRIYGITDMHRLQERSPTFAFRIDGHTPQEISAHLAASNISAGAGHFYALGLTDALGLTQTGGVVRAGGVHYNTLSDIDRLFEALERL